MSYGCRCNCKSFREHALGVSFAPSSMPSRTGGKDAQFRNDTEKKWERENAAYRSAAKDGYTLPHLNGADKIVENATTPIEMQHGRLYGDKAEIVQKAADGEYNA